MMKGRLGISKRISAWILALVMVVSLMCVPAGQVQAASVEVDLNPCTDSVTATANEKNQVEVRFDVPEQYDTLSELSAAGINKLQVTFKVTQYTASGSEAVGAQAFLGHGSSWENSGSWQNITQGIEITSTLDLSSYLSSSDSVYAYGIQFANITGSFTYQITSAKLIGPGTWDVEEENISLSYTAQAQYDSYIEYYFTVKNSGSSAVTGDLVITFDQSREKNWWTENFSIGLSGNILTVSNLTVPANGSSDAIQVQLKPTGANITSVSFGGKTIAASGTTLGATSSGGGSSSNDDYTGSMIYTLQSDCMDDAVNRPVDVHGKLHVDMSTLKLTDENGNPFQLRGVSTHGINWDDASELEYQYVNFQSFKNARDILNANAMRLAMYTSEYNGYTTGGDQSKLKYRVDKGVKCATALGMYVIVDWHILNSNPKDNIEEAKSYFDYVSKQYGNYDNVLYEICNEPCGGIWSDIKSYAETIIPIIRANDPDAVIIVGTPTWSQDVDIAKDNPLKDSDGTLMDNVMYTVHFYANTHGQSYRDKVAAAVNTIPIFCTEYGMCLSSGGGSNNFTESTAWLNYLDEKCISYFVWNLSEKNETSSLIKNGSNVPESWTASNLSESGNWIKEQYAERKNVNNTTGSTTESTTDLKQVSLNQTVLELEKGNTQELICSITPSNADIECVEWSSDNEGIATVNGENSVASGKAVAVVTAVNKSDSKATITVTVTSKSGSVSTATCQVGVVGKKVTGVSLDKNVLSMVVGEENTLKATVTPDDADSKDVTWTSSNASVATVDNSGNVTAVGAGTATITVTTADGNYTASCTVTVSKKTQAAPSNVTYNIIDRTSNTLKIGVSTISYPSDSSQSIEYSIDGGVTWDADGKFENLTPFTKYEVWVRVAGNDTYNPSAVAESKFTAYTLVADSYTIDVSKLAGDEASQYIDALRENANAQPTATYENGTLTLAVAGTTYTITGNNSNVIVKAPYSNTKVVLDNATIKQLDVTNDTASEITVKGTSTVAQIVSTGNNDVSIAGTGTLNTSNIEVKGTLTIGDTTVIADAAGTANPAISAKNVIINCSKVTATGGNDSSAIEATNEIAIKDATVEVNVAHGSDKTPITATKIVISGATSVVSDSENIYSTEPEDENGSAVISYIVTYQYEDMAQTANVVSGSTIALPDIPEQTGYTMNWQGTDGNIYAAGTAIKVECNLTFTVVKQPIKVTQIQLTPATKNVKVGDSFTLQASVLPVNALDKSVEWSSDNSNIAAVDQNGLVKALAEGQVVIKATAKDGSGCYAQCSVIVETVSEDTDKKDEEDTSGSDNKGSTEDDEQEDSGENKKNEDHDKNSTEDDKQEDSGEKDNESSEAEEVDVESIRITGATRKVAPGKKITLKATVYPTNATNQDITWKVSNQKYASVNSKGVVTAKKAGKGKKVTVTAISKADGSVKATYRISIMKNAVKKIKLSAKTKTIKRGKSVTVKAKFTPSKGISKELTWTSSNSKIATVNSKGKVVAKKKGKVKITAKAKDGSGKKATITIRVK